ncbi:hypothetical protein MRX96_047829 [Rhipicephalus microplus]
MNNLLNDLLHAVVYFDNILVRADTEEDHWRNVSKILKHLQDAGLRLKLEKWKIMKDRVEYLGHVITDEGLHLSFRNVEAILSAPRPQDVKTLQSLMRLINLYWKFIPRLLAALNPLNGLLVPGTLRTWAALQEEAFRENLSESLGQQRIGRSRSKPLATTVFACHFRPCPVWVPATVEADKVYAAVLRLRDGRQGTWHHDRVRVVPWPPDLSEYSGHFRTDPRDASSVPPAVTLDAVDAAKAYAPADNTCFTATTGVSSEEFKDTRVTSDPGDCASAPVDAPKPEALSQTPLRRSSRNWKHVLRYVPQ